MHSLHRTDRRLRRQLSISGKKIALPVCIFAFHPISNSLLPVSKRMHCFSPIRCRFRTAASPPSRTSIPAPVRAANVCLPSLSRDFHQQLLLQVVLIFSRIPVAYVRLLASHIDDGIPQRSVLLCSQLALPSEASSA